MVDRSTRCISQVFGFLKEIETCENCEVPSSNDLEGELANDLKSNMIKKSVSDTKIFKQPVQHQPQIKRKCICHLRKPLLVKTKTESNSVETAILENGDVQSENISNGEVCQCGELLDTKDLEEEDMEGKTREEEINTNHKVCEENGTNGFDQTDIENDVMMRSRNGQRTTDDRSNTQVVSEMFRFLNAGSLALDEEKKSETFLESLSMLVDNEEIQNKIAKGEIPVTNSEPEQESLEQAERQSGNERSEENEKCEKQLDLKRNLGNICVESGSSESVINVNKESVSVPLKVEQQFCDQEPKQRQENSVNGWEGKDMPGHDKHMEGIPQVSSITALDSGSAVPDGNHGNSDTTCDDSVFVNKGTPCEKNTKDESSPGVVKRRKHSSRKTESDDHSDDSSDEDTGIYAESYRNSTWIRLDEEDELNAAKSASLPTRKTTETSVDVRVSSASMSDEVFTEGRGSPPVVRTHKRSDSSTTTLSETEFKRQYTSRRKCLIQRDESQQEYHRLSARYYDEERILVIQKEVGEADQDFGLHILDCQPAYITSVDPGSPAARAGAQEGQILISVNGVNVLEAGHGEIVRLMQQNPSVIKLEVAYSDFQPVRDLQASVMCGHMYKLGNSTLMRTWKKRYFILRQDNCLYYYKTEQEQIPLGAVPLAGYSISRYIDTNKDYCFKADKYGARSYYFMTDSRDDMTRWVGKLTEAATRSKKRKDSWLDVSSHNVGLPALEIRRPECTGYLTKMGRQRKVWKKRYCVLKDACIYYYKLMSSHSAQGVAHLHGYVVDEAGLSGKRYSFILRPPEPGMRTFFFCAENETDKARWVEAMQRSIQRWVKVDK